MLYPYEMSSTNNAKKINALAQSQAWIYKFILPDGSVSPGPERKGPKNIAKVRVIQSLDLKGKNVLDVGCAEGMFSFYMAEEGANVTGIEVNRKRFEKAEFIKSQINISNVQFNLINAEKPESWTSLSSKFDFGFCFSVLHRVSDPFNLIGNLAGKCDTLIFEWKAPEGFISDKISLAFHEVEGQLDPRNIDTRDSLLSDESIMDSGLEKPYWCPTVGTVQEICGSFGFKTFKVIKIDTLNPIKVAYAYFDFLKKLFFRSNKPVAWRRYKRVMMICSRDEVINFEIKKIIKRHKWDGTVG